MKGNYTKGKKILLIAIALIMIISYALIAITSANASSDNDIDTSKINSILEVELEKYINYDFEETKGSIVELDVKTGIEYEEGQEYTPLSATGVVINSPKINGKFPENVEVIKNATLSTNGNEKAKDVEYTYDPSTGEIKVATYNKPDNSGKIFDANIKDARDNFKLVLSYDKDCYTANGEKRELEVTGYVQSKLAINGDIKVKSELDKKFELTEDVSGLVSNKLETSKIYSGYIAANAKGESNYKTEYTEKLGLEISKKEVSDVITVEVSNDFEENKNLYVSSKLDKNEVLDILGENGSLQILDKDENVLAEINKDTVAEEDGTYKIEYSKETTKLFVKLTKPAKVGTIYIESNKQITEDFTDASVNEITVTSKIVCLNKVEEKAEEVKEEKTIFDVIKKSEELEDVKEETEKIEENYKTVEDEEKFEEIYTNTETENIEILETKSEVKFELDNKNWTNKNQNEVNFNIKLFTSKNQNSLFKNPSFEIQLPSEVEKVNLNVEEAKCAFGNGLKLSYIEYDEGTNVIRVILEGEQKEYLPEELASATEISIPATLILGKGIEDTTADVKLAYTNYATSENGEIKAEVEVENYEEEQVEDVVTNGMQQVVNTNTENENIENENTENENAGDIVKLRSRKFEDVKVTASGLELKVTPTRGDKTLESGDTVHEGEFIKYNITLKNITNKQLDNVKLKAFIPEGTVYAKYQNTFNKFDTESKYEFNESAETTTIDIGTLKVGQGITTYYEVKVSDLDEGVTEKELTSYIYGYIGNDAATKYEIAHKVEKSEYEILATATRRGPDKFNIFFEITDKENKGENVTVEWKLPEGLEFYTLNNALIKNAPNIIPVEDGVTKMELAPGKYFMAVLVNREKTIKTPENDYEKFFTNFTVNDKYQSNELLTTFYYKSARIEMTSDNEGEELKYGDEITYKIRIENTSRIDYRYSPAGGVNEAAHIDVNLKDYLPEHVEPISIKYNSYSAVRKNKEGSVNASDVDYVEEVEEKDISGIIRSEDGTQDANANIDFIVPYEGVVEIEIKAKAGYVYKKTTVDNTATLYEIKQIYDETSEDQFTRSDVKLRESNTVSHVILPDGYDVENPTLSENPIEEPTPTPTPTPTQNPTQNPTPTPTQNPTENPTENPTQKPTENPSENPTQNPTQDSTQKQVEDKKYSISGLAWKDSNEDGKRQTSEGKVSGVEVLLVDSTGKIVNTTKTSNSGKYSFDNVEKGKYIVLFKYNTTKYRPTEYHKNNVKETENSDAMGTTRDINGTKITCGVTDLINLTSSVANLDLGLLENKKFNFKVDNYVSKVTVKGSNGTKESVFDKSQLAKVEIHSKEIDGATLIVEYKIVITNNGELPGKVGTVIDTLPDGLKFSSELSKSWAKNADGTLINNSIANKTIEPGNSVELTLIATKSMTANGTGTFKNTAKIESLSNDAKIQETDTTDNTSSADLIISVSTGTVVYIVSIMISTIALIALLIFLNMKFKIFRKLKIFGLIALIVLLNVNNSEAYHDGWYDKGDTICIHWTDTYSEVSTDSNYGWTWYCDNYGSGDGSAGYDGSYTVYKKVTDVSRNGSSTPQITNSEEYNWKLKMTDAGKVKMHEEGDYYIIGPIGIENVGNYDCEDFEFTITSYDGTVTKTTKNVCDENGNNEHTTHSSGTYYIKVSKTEFASGVSKIKVKSKIGYIQTTKTKYSYWAHAQQKNGQDMHSSTEYEKEEEEKKTKEDELEWTVETCNLTILKYDEFGTDEYGKPIDLSGINFIIKGPSGWLMENGKLLVRTSDSTGKTQGVEGLDAGSYTVYEIISGGGLDMPDRLQDFYKEKEEVDVNGTKYKVKSLGTADISAGQAYTYRAKNSRDRITLILRKIDKSDKQNLGTVKFKIKEVKSGKWVTWRENTGADKATAKYIVDGTTDQYDINDPYSTLTTKDDGYTERVKRFDIGEEYEIYEVDPGEYKYLYEVNELNGGTDEGLLLEKWTAVADAKGIIELVEENDQFYGSLNIDKYEPITDARLAGIGFKIKINGNGTKYSGQWLVVKETIDSNTNNKIYEVTGYTKDFNDATIFYTQADGKTYDIKKLPCENCTYDVYEVEIPTELQPYFTLDQVNFTELYEATNESEALLIKKGLTVEKEKDPNDRREPKNVKYELPNNQAFIYVSGNVWEEVPTFDQNKNQNAINNLLGEEDFRINGIPVRIIDTANNNAIVQETVTKAYTDANGNVINGHYVFEKVKISKLEDYVIEFTYDGVTYHYVLDAKALGIDYTYKNEDDAKKVSEATEKEADRENLNNTFTELTGEEQKMNYKGKDITLTYTKKDDYVVSNNICDRDENIDITNRIVTLTDNGDFTIEANTDNVKEFYDNWVGKYAHSQNLFTEIPYLNLGLYVRTQPDFSLDKDVYKADIAVNGKNYTYIYGKKDGNTPTTIGVQFEKNVQLDPSDRYLLPVYRADVEKYTGPEEYAVKVTYRIKLMNDSVSLYGRINKLEEYFSAKFQNDSSNLPRVFEGTKTTIGNEISVDFSDFDVATDGSTHCTISGLDVTLKPQETRYLYIEFDVNKKIVEDALKNLNNEEFTDFYNRIEISSYTTFSDDNFTKLYAGFDVDSIPNNTFRKYNSNKDPKDEDDVDRAPGLRIVEASARTLSGKVFEDNPLAEKLNAKERIGNGYYDEGENTIEGVIVTLQDVDNPDNTYSVKTNSAGEFTINGFYASNYKLIYAWGDSKYNGTRYKSTILNSDYVDKINALSTQKQSNGKDKPRASWWYQNDVQAGTLYSEAVDNYTRRKTIDENSAVTFEDMKDNNLKVEKMYSETEMLSIEIDVLSTDENFILDEQTNEFKFYYNINNIDFGVIERPQQSLQITKQLSHIQVVDNYGTVIAESDINDKGELVNKDVKYTIALPSSPSNQYGTVKVEIDNSYLPVNVIATYTIKTANTSEKDYYRDDNLANYYIYGIVGEADKPVKLKPTGVYDYITESFAIESVKDADGNDKEYEIVTEENYSKSVNTKYTTERTIVETGFEREVSSGDVNKFEWASDREQIKQICEEWLTEIIDGKTTTVRRSKLDGKKILELKSLESELAAGEENAVKVQAKTTVASAKDEVLLQNETEITNIDRTSKFGRTPLETYTTLYDRGEEIIVTPPTGEDKDSTSTIVITTVSIIGIAILGAGIVLIKKKVLDA